MEAQSNKINHESIEVIMHKSKFLNTDVLVHSNQPIRLLSPVMLKEFQNDFCLNMNMEQIIGLSHVFNGDSLLICTTNGDDPSLYYFPAVCRIIEQQILKSQDTSFGPIAIILVPTDLHAFHMIRLCAAFLSPRCLGMNGLATAIGNMDNNKMYIQLKKGCGILVATFAHFELLLAQNVMDNLIDKSRLKHVIIDDLDVMSSYHNQKFLEIMSVLVKLCLTESNGQQIIVPQFIITSQSYNVGLMPFLIRHIRRPLIIFKDFIEASVYGGINFTIMTTTGLSSKKDLLLLGLKKFNPLEQRTIIFCKNFKDVLEVQSLFTQNGIDFLVGIYNELAQVNSWKSNLSRKILICTDDIVSLRIHEADNVIHYTYPDSWYSFKKRHSVLFGNYQNMMNADFCSVKGVKQNVVALTNEHDAINLHRLIELFIKQKQEVNPQMLQLTNAQLHRSTLEYARQRFHVCPDLTIYGSCKAFHCAYIHYLGPRDFLTKEQQAYVPRNGIVTIQILQVYATTHFAVRLLKWKASMQSEFYDLPLSYNTLLNKLQLFYKNIEYPALYWPPKEGEICVAKVGSQYQRIRILMVPKNNKTPNNRMVSGQFVDENMNVQEFKCSNLFVCPREILVVPPMVMHLYMSAILPNALMAQNTEKVKSWLNLECQGKGKVRYEAKIFEALPHAIFASNLSAYKKISNISEEEHLDLNHHLVKEGYGKYDSNNIYRIKQIFFSNQK